MVLLLNLEDKKSTEHVRGILLALVLWDPSVHGRLPACVFVEEVLEASLSRLGQVASTDLRATTAKDFSEMYTALGPPSIKEHRVNKSQVSFVLFRSLESEWIG